MAPDDPIILGGFFRSGTSLLRRLLDAHSEVHCGPEVKFFKDFYADYMEDGLRHVRFFSTVRSLGLGEDRLLEVFGEAFIRAHEGAARQLGKRRWADKAPENVLYLEQWRHLLRGRLFFVHVVRHPLDALASLAEIGFPKTVPGEFDEKVALYRRFAEAGLAFERSHPDISRRVHYESLVAEPEATTRGLMQFLGLEHQPAVLTEFNGPGRQLGVEDPKVRRSPTIHAASVGRWHRDLSPEQVASATAALAGVRAELGYPVW